MVFNSRHMVALVALMALLALLVGASLAMAETRYIRDLVIVNLRSLPDNEYETVKLLRSGDVIEVLKETAGYVEVKTEDGQRGWISKQYTSTEPPSILLLRQAEARLDRVQAELDKSRNAHAKAQAELNDMHARLDEESKLGGKALSRARGKASKLEKDYNKLKKDFEELNNKSSNVMEIDAERQKLAQESEKMAEELMLATERMEDLTKMAALKWFALGAIVLFSGWLLGIVMGKKRKNRAFS